MKLFHSDSHLWRCIIWVALLVTLIPAAYGIARPIQSAGNPAHVATSRHKHKRHKHRRATCIARRRARWLRRHHKRVRRPTCKGHHHRSSVPQVGSMPPVGSAPTGFFAPTSIWNAPVPANAPLDPNSGAVVNSLLAQITPTNLGIGTTNGGVPIYTVGPDQPGVHVTLNQGPGQTNLHRAFDAVPIPAGAQPDPGSDENLAVYRPSTNEMWEFWKLTHTSTGWSADWGGGWRTSQAILATTRTWLAHRVESSNVGIGALQRRRFRWLLAS